MRLVLLILVAVTACTRYVTPTPPQNAAPAALASAPAKPAKAIENRAAAPGSLIATHLDPQAKCSLWSGRGTEVPDEHDAVLCLGSSWLLYCNVPDDGKPRCDVVADWSAATAKPAEAPPAAPPAKKK